MPFYASSDQFYATLRQLFERVREDTPNPVDALLSARLAIRLHLSQPQAAITIDGRRRPVEIAYGNSSPLSRQRADLEAELSADTLHQILLDELTLMKAIGNRQLKVRGPIWRTKPLAEILDQGKKHYPQILREQGLK